MFLSSTSVSASFANNKKQLVNDIDIVKRNEYISEMFSNEFCLRRGEIFEKMRIEKEIQKFYSVIRVVKKSRINRKSLLEGNRFSFRMKIKF